MKKYTQLSSLLCLVIFLFTLLPLTTHATESCNSSEISIDLENYLHPIEVSRNSRLYGVEFHLFTMEATRLSGLLTTHGTNKYFYGSSIPDAAVLYYMGTLTKYNGSNPTAGICYRRSDGYNKAVHKTEFESGVWTASENLDASDLDDDKKYLGFINGTGTGETHGSIQFWYWDTSK